MTTTDTAALTRQYRRQQAALRATVLRDLQRLWPALDWKRLDRTYPAWATAVGALVERHRRNAASLAIAYLRAFREAAGVPGELREVLALGIPPAQLNASLRVTGPVAFKRAIADGRSEEDAADIAFVMSAGAVTRLILEAARSSMLNSLAADPEAVGWRRITSGNACAFCRMLAGRGAVYSAKTATFAAHDHCACSAEPVYGGDRRKVKPYAPSSRNISDADRARLREYLRQNYS